jgi:pimeloyl-ACP methyl ester carboxylesterase
MDRLKPEGERPDRPIMAGLNTFTFHDGQLFYLYVPRRVMVEPRGARILVSIHGYTGSRANARGRAKVRKYVEYWIDLADKKGWVVLAPHFDERRFNKDYQRLNPSGVRADLRLNELVDEVGRRLPGIFTDRFYLFGFSGGGQFVHRYLTFSPERVCRAVCGAPGWYLWRDPSLPYPVGTAPKTLPHGLRPRWRELCRTKVLLIVGQRDIAQRAFRRRYRKCDLMGLQGKGRRERAVNWFASLRQMANEKGWPFTMAFKVLPRAGHVVNPSFLACAGSYLCQD